MTDSRDQQTPEPIESVLTQFDARKDTLEAFCARTKSLIEQCLQDAGIRYQSVQARVKTRKKLTEKYISKSYQGLDDATDLAALRIITYYEDEVDRVAEIVKREFDVDLTDSVDKRDTDPDRFGYYALNYVCRHLERRRSDVEYKKFAEVRCEIQITSILRHAWSEIEHDWYDLKESYPDVIRRRFYRLAALLEIAESEFLDLRKSKASYRQSVSVQVEARVPNLVVDSVSLKPFVEQDPLVAKIDGYLSSLLGLPLQAQTVETIELRSKTAKRAGLATLQDLRDAIERYDTAVIEYVDRCRQFWRPQLTPAGGLGKGICIVYVALMFIADRGEQQFLEAIKDLDLKMDFTQSVREQVMIAQEIVKKRRS